MTMKPALIFAAVIAWIAAAPLGAQTTSTETVTAQNVETTATGSTLETDENTSPVLQDEATTEPPAPEPAPSLRNERSTAPDVSTTAPQTKVNPAPPTPEPSQPEPSTPADEPTTAATDASLPGQTPRIPESDAPTETLNDGLTYQILRPGTGREADTTSTRRIHYTLWLADGTFVESSRTKEYPHPFQFVPNAQQAIAGMEQGTNSMRIGEIRKLHIPARLAYGNQKKPNIPANSDLVFVVELVDLVEPDPTE